ncbi:MAG: energy-coupling factor transporter ATPase [Thermoplasmata archaeon]|nr:MAG: energy-coupling factor transporter ATPase [Thermoplasmata archaeon]
MKAIEVNNLSFKYPSTTANVYSLQSIDFQAEKGKIIAILGENGAGKTTLMKHFNGILEPTTGNVLIDGVEITRKNLKTVRRKVGMVFQNPDDQLFSPTVAQDVAFGPMNLGLPPDEVKKRVASALNSVGMAEHGEKPPHELSTGEKKRVCFAGVLAMKPEILVLDEPTANLDPKGASDIIAIISRLNQTKNITVVIATHNVNIVPELADEIYVMHKGKILKKGTPREIFQSEKLLKRANLDIPEISKLMLLLKREGYKIDFPLSIDEALKELKNLLDDGHA